MHDEDQPKPTLRHTVGEDLAPLSLEELADRIALLKGEIARIEAAIAAKRTSADVADSFFKR